MDIGRQLQDEKIIVGFVVLSTLFLYVTMDATIGTFYALGSILYLMTIFSKDSKWFIQITAGRSKLGDVLLISVVSLLAVSLISQFVLKYYGVQEFSILSYFNALSDKTNLPITSDNMYVKFAVWDIIIPIVESLIIVSFAYKLFSNMLKIDTQGKFNLKVLWLILLIGATGAVFHFTVRIYTDYALVLDAVFFSISAFVAWKYKELLPVILIHIINNSLVLLISSGLL